LKVRGERCDYRTCRADTLRAAVRATIQLGKGKSVRQQSSVALVDYRQDRVMHVLESVQRPFQVAVANCGSYVVHDAGYEISKEASLP